MPDQGRPTGPRHRQAASSRRRRPLPVTPPRPRRGRQPPAVTPARCGRGRPADSSPRCWSPAAQRTGWPNISPGWTPAPGSVSARPAHGLHGDSLPASPGNPRGGCGSRRGRPAGRCRRGLRCFPLDQQGPFVALRPALIAGGLGAHKCSTGGLLADLARSMALDPDEQLLIEDDDGELLETDRANIFAVIDGVLCTPPADGRLLPGVTRDALLRAAASMARASACGR